MWQAIDQCEGNRPEGTDPAIVFKKNGKQPYVAIPFTVFCDMLQLKYDTGEQWIKNVNNTSEYYCFNMHKAY